MSHALERFAVASDRDSPMVVMSMFQRLSYFRREAAMYADIGARAALTLVGVVEDLPPRLAPGVQHVRLAEDEELAREWSVTVLSPRAGATLVAHDLESVDGSARSLESGRMFSGWWSFRRSDAFEQLVRLRDSTAHRLTGEQIRSIDHVLDQVVAVPGRDVDDRTDAALDLLVDELSQARRQADHAHNRLDEVVDVGERDLRTRLPNAAFLGRWTQRSATGTLPVGLVLLRVHDLANVRERYGFRAELAVLQALSRTLRAHCGSSADRALRVGPDEFALVLPGRGRPAAVAERVRAAVLAQESVFPFVPTPATAAVMLTRSRPLPLDQLRAALDEAAWTGWPVVELPPT